MSRVADAQPLLPGDIQFSSEQGVLSLKGAKGELNIPTLLGIAVAAEKQEDGTTRLVCKYNKENKEENMQAGTIMAQVRNALEGLSKGFSVKMTLKGTGYKVEVSGNKVKVASGKSHFDFYELPEGIKASTPDAVTLMVEGIDKCQVGMFVDRVRKGRDARRDPYKLRGWLVEKPWKVEFVRRKEQVKK